MQNVGKLFEQDFKNSVPEHILILRIPDPPQVFIRNEYTKFAVKNPCDFVVYDSKHLFLLELKTTKAKMMSFEKESSMNSQRMIHKHQIDGLTKYGIYDNVVAGFIFNFRKEDEETETLYFQSIDDFNKMCASIDKQSFNKVNLIDNNAMRISGEKKRTRYRWDLQEFFDSF